MRRVGLGFLIGASATSLLFLVAFQLMPPRFPEGATAAGVDVGGMTTDEAEKAVGAWWQSRKGVAVTLSNRTAMGAKTLSVNPSDIGIGLDKIATVEESARLNGLVRLPRKVRPLEPAVTAKWVSDEAKYIAFLKRLVQFDREPGKPKLRYDGTSVTIERATPGWTLDKSSNLEALRRAFLEGKQTTEAVFAPADMSDVEREMEKIKSQLGSWSTTFRASQRSRCHNINLAIQKLDGLVLMPGDVFSYNGTVGRRSAKTGFKMAPTFVQGRHVDDFGGGICQVSSTLYNAVLLSGLKIVERHNHQMLVGYVPAGRDATVDFGSKDLKFENSTGGPIAISAQYKPGRITLRILGAEKDLSNTVKLVVTDQRSYGAKSVVETDPNMKPGSHRVVEKGGRGMRCKAWRFFYKDGELVRKEFLSSNYYMPSTRVVRAGPSAATAKPAEAPEDPAGA